MFSWTRFRKRVRKQLSSYRNYSLIERCRLFKLGLVSEFGFLHTDLPGFYFDPELNRYFPLPGERGRNDTVQSLYGGASSSKQVRCSLSLFEVSLTRTARIPFPSLRFLLCMRWMINDHFLHL